jgi:hypothetical protein
MDACEVAVMSKYMRSSEIRSSMLMTVADLNMVHINTVNSL